MFSPYYNLYSYFYNFRYRRNIDEFYIQILHFLVVLSKVRIFYGIYSAEINTEITHFQMGLKMKFTFGKRYKTILKPYQ